MHLRMLLLILACGPAWGQSVGVPPLHGPSDARDAYGRAWYSQQISAEADFGAGTTLNAEARESLALHIEGARRFFRATTVCAWHDERLQMADARRLGYLRWWLGLQDVRLLASRDGGALPPQPVAAPGRTVITLRLEPCGP